MPCRMRWIVWRAFDTVPATAELTGNSLIRCAGVTSSSRARMRRSSVVVAVLISLNSLERVPHDRLHPESLKRQQTMKGRYRLVSDRPEPAALCNRRKKTASRRTLAVSWVEALFVLPEHGLTCHSACGIAPEKAKIKSGGVEHENGSRKQNAKKASETGVKATPCRHAAHRHGTPFTVWLNVGQNPGRRQTRVNPHPSEHRPGTHQAVPPTVSPSMRSVG